MSGLVEAIVFGILASLVIKAIWGDEYPVPRNKTLRVIVKIIYTIVTVVTYVVLLALILLNGGDDK